MTGTLLVVTGILTLFTGILGYVGVFCKNKSVMTVVSRLREQNGKKYFFLFSVYGDDVVGFHV